MVLIAFVGSHGVGKSTTARIVADKLNAVFIEVEAYSHDITPYLDSASRQLYFFAEYLRYLLQGFSLARRGAHVVLSNHPLNVIPYNYWWITDRKLAEQLSKDMLKILNYVQKVDLLVLLEVDRVEIVLERVRMRGRALYEELNVDYITTVDRILRDLIHEFGPKLARKVLIVPCSLEASTRADIVLREVRQGMP